MPSTLIAPSPPAPAGARLRCRHCGAALLDERMRASGFCCAGCGYVYRLVHEHGLDAYYRIKDAVTAPADSAVFQARDYGWLELAQREAEADPGRIPELTLALQGVSCAGCVWLIEHVFRQQPGARDINANAAYGTLHLRWQRGEFAAADFARTLQAFGYLVGPTGGSTPEPESRGLVQRIGLCAAFAMNTMLFSLPVYFGMKPTEEWAGLFGILSFVFGTLSFLVGGTYFLGRAFQAVRARALHIDLPIALGVTGAYGGSVCGWLLGEERFVYFDFVSAFVLLMLIGRWAQVAAVERNRRRLLARQPQPQPVRLAEGGEVPPEQVRAGQGLVLASGQMLPVAARLESPEAVFSLASINGEAEPRTFRSGQRVPAGAVNVGRADLRLAALQGWPESLLAELLRPSERADARQLLLERIVRGYLIGILAVAAAAGIGWWLATGDPVRTGAVVVAVLVVSCPCAIALAFPLADEIATVALRRSGVFVRDGGLWAKLARVRRIVFDKTGTLTLETPVLQNPEALTALDPAARDALFRLVRDNPHPVSQCLLENLLAAEGPSAAAAGTASADEIRESIGHGVEWGLWSLGRPGWRAGPDEQGTVLARGNRLLASFCFLDTARPAARAEVAALQAAGYSLFILSGDRREKVLTLAAELGLPPEHAQGDLDPRQKAAWLEAHAPADALMLGDGANDSLAFDRALCRGTPVIHRGVLERKADFYYLSRGIGGIRALFEVDAIRRRTQMIILIFSLTYNLLVAGLAVAGRMNPMVAAILMPASSLITLAIVGLGMRPALARRG